MLPFWLASGRALVIGITDRQDDCAKKVSQHLKNQGSLVDLDLRNEKIGLKIRQHTVQKVPYLLVVGDREEENGTVSVGAQNGEDLGSLNLDAITELFTDLVAKRDRLD